MPSLRGSARQRKAIERDGTCHFQAIRVASIDNSGTSRESWPWYLQNHSTDVRNYDSASDYAEASETSCDAEYTESVVRCALAGRTIRGKEKNI